MKHVLDGVYRYGYVDEMHVGCYFFVVAIVGIGEELGSVTEKAGSCLPA